MTTGPGVADGRHSGSGRVGMSAGAGLLGYLGRDVEPGRLEAAGQRSPWRGSPSATFRGSIGGIVALGSALAGRHRHLVVAIHGRIDNLSQAASAVDTSQDDICAVLGELYLRNGDAFASRLLGDFAILILDERQGVLLGVRDWIGARPLFWGQHDGVTAFASEVKQALVLLDRPYQLDEETAARYRIMKQPNITATFARDIQAVRPSGHVLARVDRTPVLSTRPIVFEPHDLSMDEAAALIRTRMDVAVERRLEGAQRPAALISGGMDSTSVAATAASLARRGRGAPLVAGIGLHFPDVPRSDETRYAQEVAHRWQIPWHPVAIHPSELADSARALLALHDGPVFPGIQMFTRLFEEAKRAGADALLTGQGADRWQTQGGLELLFSILRREWRTALTWVASDLVPYPRSTLRQLARAVKAVRTGRQEAQYFVDRVDEYWARTAFEVEERLGLFYGMRVEAPFADQELAAALVGIRPGLRSSPDGEKLPLRAAMADRLPDSVLNRMDKSFFDLVFIEAFGLPEPGEGTSQKSARLYLEAWNASLNGLHAHEWTPFRVVQAVPKGLVIADSSNGAS